MAWKGTSIKATRIITCDNQVTPCASFEFASYYNKANFTSSGWKCPLYRERLEPLKPCWSRVERTSGGYHKKYRLKQSWWSNNVESARARRSRCWDCWLVVVASERSISRNRWAGSGSTDPKRQSKLRNHPQCGGNLGRQLGNVPYFRWRMRQSLLEHATCHGRLRLRVWVRLQGLLVGHQLRSVGAQERRCLVASFD